MDKQALRDDAKRILRGIAAETKALHSRQIRGFLEGLIRRGSHRAIAAYAALPNEPDLDALFWDLPLQWALPRMAAGQIELRRVRSPDDLAPGTLTIREPDPDTCQPVSILDTDLILVPGLAFSKTGGGRLGRGKGHYDRFLSTVSGKDARPLILGICFEAQIRDEIPLESHDIRMDGIVTENGVSLRRR